MKAKNKENAAIGTFIRNHLAHSGMQQTELAKRLGIHPSTLNQMISGVAPLPMRRFYQIADILNMSQDEIEAVNEIYRSRLLITPEQSKQFFIKPSEAKGQAVEEENPTTNDFIFNRIAEIYAQLDRAGRAEMLAAAERLAGKNNHGGTND